MRKVFLFAGQSNSMGYGDRGKLNPRPAWNPGPADASSDTGIVYDRPTAATAPALYAEYYGQPLADSWGQYVGQTPLATGTQERGAYGPEVSFLARWREDNPSGPLAVLKYAVGGTSLAEWSPPSGSMWLGFVSELNRAKARLAAAGEEYECAAFVWGHGESGCSTVWPYLNDPEQYATGLRALLAAVRAETRPDLPCVVAGIGSQMFAGPVIGTYSSGIDTPENRLAATNHRLAQQQAVGADPGNVFYSRLGLPTLESGSAANWYHTTGPGYLADGERAYAAFAGWTPPPPTPPLVVRFNGTEQPGWAVALNGEPVGGNGDVIDVTG